MNILDKPKELMKKIPFKHRMKDFGLLIVAIVFYAVGTSFFFGPSGLTPGGLSGIAMTLERFDFLPFGKGIIVLSLFSESGSSVGGSLPPPLQPFWVLPDLWNFWTILRYRRITASILFRRRWAAECSSAFPWDASSGREPPSAEPTSL